jgi:hypothetical protein
MCRNGQYTERGIKQIDGFMRSVTLSSACQFFSIVEL